MVLEKFEYSRFLSQTPPKSVKNGFIDFDKNFVENGPWVTLRLYKTHSPEMYTFTCLSYNNYSCCKLIIAIARKRI